MRNKFTFLFAIAVAALVGNMTQGKDAAKAQAASVLVNVACNNVQMNAPVPVATGTASPATFTESCSQTAADTSGLQVLISITGPTQRYPLGVAANLTLP